MSAQAIKRIKARYERSVIAHPGLSIAHHADCRVYGMNICTCGLLHDLSERGVDMTGMYPAYYDEKARQDHALDLLRLTTTGGGFT